MGETVVLYGPSGSGKTSQALTWPGPVVNFDLEYGLHRAWGIKQDGGLYTFNGQAITRKVYERDFQLVTSVDHRIRGCMEAWLQFTTDYVTVCKQKKGTIILDTATIIWKLCCDAYLQQLQIINPTRERIWPQVMYAEPNRRMSGLIDTARMYGVNVVWIHHERDEYVQVIEPVTNTPQVDKEGEPVRVTSGKKLPDGFTQIWSKADWVLYSKGPEDGGPSTTIKKSPAGWSLVGLTIQDFSCQKLEQVVAMSNGEEV